MDEILAGRTSAVIGYILDVVCIGAFVYVLVVLWRRAKRAGENPRAALWPFGMMVIALILAEVACFALDPRSLFLWIIMGVAFLLVIIGAALTLKRSGQHNQMK